MKQQDGVGLSFLDMLSCGLGGMILLFLIFSTFQHQGVQRPSKDRPPPVITKTDTVVKDKPGEVDPTKMPRLWRLSFDPPAPIEATTDGDGIVVGHSDEKSPSDYIIVFVAEPDTATGQTFTVKSGPSTNNPTLNLVIEEIHPGARKWTEKDISQLRCTLDLENGWRCSEYAP